MAKRRNFSLVVEGSPSPKWIVTIVETLVTYLINAPSQRKTNTRRSTRVSKMTQVTKMKVRRRKTRHIRRRMARRRISTRRRRMARHTSLVIGSRILIHQVAHPMMIVRTRRWPLL